MTHGHYQIELDCDACHASHDADAGSGSVGAFMQDSCNRCHATQLRIAKDTHPAKKFNDPTNADRLLMLDAQNCITCHKEHVPEQTLEMGLTVPKDYCWHCHQDVGESRPSHQGMQFDSCATAGCHNYHDNRSLYEKYLDHNYGQPDVLQNAILPRRLANLAAKRSDPKAVALSLVDADAPHESISPEIADDWVETAHAAAGVNCKGCHSAAGPSSNRWVDQVAMETCEKCHQRETESFLSGRHGMRIASGLSPMSPEIARQPMRSDAQHQELTCNACHSGHRFDTQYASVQACQKCHSDSHTLAYEASPHAELWRQEMAGESPEGSGVSCASCHLPRLSDDDTVWVNHDQNANLRPNETMAREVCSHCHGLEFSLSSLADPNSMDSCFGKSPTTRVRSVEMAHAWFEEQDRKRDARKRGRAN